MNPVAPRRIAAFAVDWLVIAAWGGVLLAVVMLLNRGQPPRPENAWSAQALGLATMTLPVLVYFALTESSAAAATLGKRALGLRVAGADGDRLPLGRALLRNAVKFLPWELGHLVAWQAYLGGSAGVPGWVLVPMSLATLLPLWWFVALVISGRPPYDRWSGARVVREEDARSPAEGTT